MIVDPSISQPQPLPTMGVRSSQDIVDHLDKVMAAQPPEVQAAVDHAHGILGLQSPVQQPAVGAESPMAASAPIPAPQGPQAIAAPPAGMSPIVDAGSPSDVQPLPTPKLAIASPVTSDPASGLPITPSDPQSSAAPAPLQNPHMANLERMTAEGAGTNKIHNPFLRGLATVGDAIGSGLFPEFARFVPGTSAHHQQLIGQEEGQLGQEQKATKAVDESRLQNAQATEQESLPELHKTQTELAASKLTNSKEISDAKQGTADAKQALLEAEAERKRGESQQRIAAGLAEHGLKFDAESNQLIPLTYAEMSEPQKAAHDLKAAQSELTTARKDYVKAQKDGIPAAQELARRRVESAQESAATAAGRLGLSRDEFNAQFLGTAPGGAPLAGGETDESGHPIGTKIAAANKPGAAAQGRASQAGSIIEAGDNLKSEIDKHKGKIGNLGSYWNQAVNGTPISDPDAARLMSEIASYAALQPAMHGMRGGEVMREFEKMVGGIPKNPEALKAAIDGIAATASVMQKQGQPHAQHAGATPAVKKYNPATGKLE